MDQETEIVLATCIEHQISIILMNNKITLRALVD